MIRRLLVSSVLCVLGCAGQPPSGSELDAYLLVTIEAEERVLLRQVHFRHIESGTDVVIGAGREPALVRVAAGRYFLRRVDNSYDNVLAARYEEPDNPLEVLEGHVNYIGDLRFTLPDGPGFPLAFEGTASPETVRWVFETHSQVVRDFPLLAVRPGLPPVLIREPAPAADR